MFECKMPLTSSVCILVSEHLLIWPGCNNKWSTTSDVFLVEQCSLHLTSEFCFVSPIKLTAWASTLKDNVWLLNNGVFQHQERFNLSCVPKILKFYFIVRKRLQFVNKTRSFIFISFAKRNLEGDFFSSLE